MAKEDSPPPQGFLNRLYEDDPWFRWKVKWASFKLNFRTSIVRYLQGIARKVCDHWWCSLHETDDGIVEDCAICTWNSTMEND